MTQLDPDWFRAFGYILWSVAAIIREWRKLRRERLWRTPYPPCRRAYRPKWRAA